MEFLPPLNRTKIPEFLKQYKKELFEAAQYGDYDKVLRIMENKHPSITNDDIQKAQDVAIWNGYNNIVQIFIQYWIQGYGDCDMHNMIRLSMLHDNYDLVESLINLHADPDDDLCNSALHCACLHRCDINMIDLLIKLKADVNSSDKYRRTPLHAATMNGNTDIVKRLLESKSDFNAASLTASRSTPLEIAQAKGYDEILKLFR
jgi:ankyrin repeat protein